MSQKVIDTIAVTLRDIFLSTGFIDVVTDFIDLKIIYWKGVNAREKFFFVNENRLCNVDKVKEEKLLDRMLS